MTPKSSGLTPTECVRLLIVYRKRWIIPTLICGVLATAYAVFMPRYWEASQALVVRGEVSNSSSNRPGKFADLYEMRTFQETILELAKSRQVLAQTLKAVADEGVGDPSIRKIESFRRKVDMRPPGGAEFGKTEVFYLTVKDRDPQRAKRLVDVLRNQLDARLGQLRDDRSQGLILELEKQVELVSKAHAVETSKLVAFESEIGSDLGELRMLHSANSGQSDLRQFAVSLKQASQVQETRVRESENLLEVLHAAQEDPEQLVAMPSTLLASQPTLRRLKDGLVDAQLRAARLGGTRTPDHPQVRASMESVQQIRKDLHRELQVAVQGVEIELGLNRDRYSTLHSQFQGVQGRLGNLAQRRVAYSTRVSAVESSQTMLDQAQKQLSEVRAGQVAALSSSLVSPIDGPQVGSSPVGLRRAAVVVLGCFGGLVLGLGWVFLSVSPSSSEEPKHFGSKAAPARESTPPLFQSAALASEVLMSNPDNSNWTSFTS